MQKTLTLLLLLLLTTAAWGQKKNASPIELPVNAEGNIYYEGVVRVDSTITKTDLYRRGREWFVNTYVGRKEVLQLDDKAEGKMMGPGRYRYSFFNGPNVSHADMLFVLNLDVKDGQYQYRIYNFKGKGADNSLLGGYPTFYPLDYDQINKDYKVGKRPRRYNGRVIAEFDEKVKSIIASLEKAMTTARAKDDF